MSCRCSPVGPSRAECVAACPRVAVCFSGFMRNGLQPLTRNVTAIFDAPTEHFDAFVNAPLERFEIQEEPLADGDALCAHLLRRGFRTCRARQTHYDALKFHHVTKGRWCAVQQGTYPNWYPVYPLRVASQLSGLSDCIGSIKAAEVAAGEEYDWIVLARLDVLKFVRWQLTAKTKRWLANARPGLNVSAPWWPTLAQHDLAVHRMSRSQPFRFVEDRLIVGKRAALLPIEDLYTRFVTGRMPHHTELGPYTPELALAHQFEHIHGKLQKDNTGRFAAIGWYVNMEPSGVPVEPVAANSQRRMPDRLGQCFFDKLMRHLNISRHAARVMRERHGSAQYPPRMGVDVDRFGGCHPWLSERLVNRSGAAVGCGEHDTRWLRKKTGPMSAFEEYMFRQQVAPT